VRRLPSASSLGLVAALVLTPAAALAQPTFHLAWDACAGMAGATADQAFAGPGVYRQVVSGTGFEGTVTGYEVVLRARAPGGLADAWRLDAAGCQADRVAIVTAAASKACPSLGGLSSLNRTITYDPASGSIDLRMSATFPPVAASAAATHTLFRIDYDLGAAAAGPTVPGAACGGADRPVCFAIVDARWLNGDFTEAAASIGDGRVTWNDPAGTTACTAATLDGVRLDELMTACASSDAEMQFLELVADRPSTFTSTLRLTVRTKDGLVVLDRADLFPGREGQPWPAGTRWLLATPGFEAATGLAADLVLAPGLDPEGGSIRLSDDRPGAPEVDALAYGHPGEPPAPAPGRSLRRGPDGTFAEAGLPDPTNASGATATAFTCRSTAAGVRIQEFAIDCAGCVPQDKPFVELVATSPGQRFAPGLRLRILGPGGAIVYDQGNLFPGVEAAAPWPEGRTWLLGSSASTPPPDRTLAVAAPRTGGTLRLYDVDAGGAVVAELVYGTAGVPAPRPGWSLVRTAEGVHVEESAPTPTRFDGQASAPEGCYGAPPPPPLVMPATRFGEISLACDGGDGRSQYIELTTTVDQELAPGLRLRARNAAGGEIFDIGDLFASRPAGSAWPAGSTWLLATGFFSDVSGLAPDGSLHVLLPADGATLTLYDTSDCEPRTVDEVAYGLPGAVSPPAPGRSLERQADGTLAETASVSPTRFDGAGRTAHACPCPPTTLVCGPQVVHRTEPASSLTCDQGLLAYDLEHATLDAGSFDGFASIDAGDVYTIGGLPEGTPLSFAAEIEFRADACGGYDASAAGRAFVRDGTNEASHVESAGIRRCASGSRVARLELQKVAGVPFRLTYRVEASGDLQGSAGAHLRLAFVDLPPGTRITSCNGYEQDGPTATRASLVEQDVTAGRVRLAWHTSSGGEVEGSLERRTEAEDWIAVATLRSGADGLLAYEDGGLEAGGRFAYRLGITEGGVRGWTETVWVDVPPRLLFALERVAPNPSAGDAFVSFSVPGDGVVRVEILDVQGRVVLAPAPVTPGPGRHTMRIAGRGRRAAGVYLLRLAHGGEVLTTKLARVR
jgi:hypothetical protein